ncbi:hypothetical protein ECE50_009270 [Chitinophaga sp. Mgbs1]|uniref:Terpene synthase n=1 Tax=Chitinophaga solisilvae TaxID=1233460 RepID=A0A3S1JJ07_9BACT|nr:hypothetical protein [Chitinophaga solisilvae]
MLKKKTQAQIKYPFPFRKNIYADELKTFILQSIDSYEMISDKMKENMKKASFDKFVSYAFPDADREGLMQIASFILWGFVFDDHYQHSPAAEVLHMIQRSVEILSGGNLRNDDNDCLKKAFNFTQNVSKVAGKDWVYRFAYINKDTFDGIMKEYWYTGTSGYPPLRSYEAMREHTSAGYVFCALAEISANAVLPVALPFHPAINRLTQLACLMIGLCNDIFSVEKERNQGDNMNVILVLEHEHSYAAAEAVQVAIDQHNELLEEFLAIKNNLPDFGAQKNTVEKYIRGIEYLLEGHLNWFTDSNNKRYQ